MTVVGTSRKGAAPSTYFAVPNKLTTGQLLTGMISTCDWATLLSPPSPSSSCQVKVRTTSPGSFEVVRRIFCISASTASGDALPLSVMMDSDTQVSSGGELGCWIVGGPDSHPRPPCDCGPKNS